eukprot:1319403-Amphidinium_carterae.1
MSSFAWGTVLKVEALEAHAPFRSHKEDGPASPCHQRDKSCTQGPSYGQTQKGCNLYSGSVQLASCSL